jgi:hypothetical protein
MAYLRVRSVGSGSKANRSIGQPRDLKRKTPIWSYKAVEDPVSGYDLHATLLHLLGLDHERLSVRHNGDDRRLTDVHGQVIDSLLA